MTDHRREVIERGRAHAALRVHAGSFDEDFEAMDSERSSRATWWPFITVAIEWANIYPDWRQPDDPRYGLYIA